MIELVLKGVRWLLFRGLLPPRERPLHNNEDSRNTGTAITPASYRDHHDHLLISTLVFRLFAKVQKTRHVHDPVSIVQQSTS